MRMFIAAEVSAELRDALDASAQRAAVLARGRFTAPTSYHLTLAFLGEADERSAAHAAEALAAACEGVGPLPLTTAALQTFGRRNGAHQTLWQGFASAPALDVLAQRVRAELDARGIAYDGKPFIAHATLARRADVSAQDLTQLNEELRPVRGCVAAATLFRSDLSSAGAAYMPIRRIALPPAPQQGDAR